MRAAVQMLNDIIDQLEHSDNIIKNRKHYEMFQNKLHTEYKNQNCLVSRCPHIKRTIHALKYYHLIIMTPKHEDNLITFCKDIYKQLIDDYSHVLINHNQHIESIYRLIQTQYCQILESCNFLECSFYKRSNRNRQLSTSNKLNSNHIHATNFNYLFWVDLFDQIHSYFLHLFHSGLRIHCDIDFDTKNKENDSCVDEKFDTVIKAVFSKRKQLEKVNIALNRFKSNKFNIKMTITNKDQYTELKQNVKNDKQDVSSFSIGYTFYYWEHYKKPLDTNQEHYANRNEHLGHQTHELYIKAKYASLKEEILVALANDEYQRCLTKLQKFMMTKTVKNMKSVQFAEKRLHFGVGTNTPISTEHLLSII
eukprot:405277_1